MHKQTVDFMQHDRTVYVVGLCGLHSVFGGHNYHSPKCSRWCGHCEIVRSAFSETHLDSIQPSKASHHWLPVSLSHGQLVTAYNHALIIHSVKIHITQSTVYSMHREAIFRLSSGQAAQQANSLRLFCYQFTDQHTVIAQL